MRVKIEKYNKEWPNIFEKIKHKLIHKINKHNISIEHIGSTSVKNLASKPIIDILIGIKKKELDDYISPIKDLGFSYIKEYEKEIPNRRFFFLENNSTRIAHIHLVEANSKWYKRHIAFRNELRTNKTVKKEYENLKFNLAKNEWKDSNDYSDAKTKFIRTIENKLVVDKKLIYK